MRAPTTLRLAALAGIALGAASGPPAQAQSTTYRVNFATENQSMWGPPSSPPISDFTLTLARKTWNNSGASRSVVSVAGFDFGGAINAATSGDVGLLMRFEAPNAGTVSVDLPVDVTIGWPAANSFRAGQTITIPTSLVISPEARVTQVAPDMGVHFVGRLGFSLSAGGEICVFGCIGFSFLPSINLPAVEAELFGLLASGAGGMELHIGNAVLSAPHTMTPEEANVYGVFGSVDALFRTVLDDRVEGSRVTARSSQEFMNLGIDMDKWYLYIHRIPIPLGHQTENRGGAQLTYETVDISAVTTGTTTQEFSFTPEVYVTLALPEALQYTVLDGETVVQHGTSARITMRIGHTLNLVFPEALRAPLEIVPTFSLTNTFSNVTSLHFTESLALTVGMFGMSVPSFEVTPSFEFTFPCIPDFWNLCSQTIPAVNSPHINVPTVGPLVEALLPVAQWSHQVFPTGPASPEWELQGFNTVAGAPFLLDPENPVIAAHTAIGSGLATGAGPAGTLTHTIRLENQGDVPLNAIQAADALAVAAGSAAIQVLSTSSPTLTTDASFDGSAYQNTLAGTDALAAQATGTVSVLLTATPGTIYRASVTAFGTSPIGTPVDITASATFALHPAVALPPHVPEHSGGVIIVRVLSAPGLDAANLDPGSVRLRGLEPLEWSLEVINGQNVLQLKFDRSSVLNSGASAAIAGVPEAPDVTAVASAVLSLRQEAGVLVAADQRGNRNGRLDLGDLRALLLGTGPDAADSVAVAGTRPARAAAAAGERVETLVLLGSWTDGTPFMAEATITVLRSGGN